MNTTIVADSGSFDAEHAAAMRDAKQLLSAAVKRSVAPAVAADPYLWNRLESRLRVTAEAFCLTARVP